MGKTGLIILTSAGIAVTVAYVDQGKSYLFQGLSVLVASISTLFFINTAVLYVYLTYFVSTRRVQDTFRPPKFTHPAILTRLLQARELESRPGSTEITQDEAIDGALNRLLSLVVRDFIQSWFQTIAKDVSFSLSVDRVIRTALTRLSQRLGQTDLMPLIQRLIPRLAAHLSDFRAAEITLRGKDLERSVTQSDELDLLLASHFRAGKLHPALTTSAASTRPTETVYLRASLDRILPLVLDAKDIESAPVRVVIREILTGSLLQPILDMLADPDFWNQTIESFLGRAIIEQEMVQRLREVLNRHASHDLGFEEDEEEEEVMNFLGKGGISADFFQEKDNKARKDLDRRKFQEFLRIVGEEKNLLDLKRLRNDVDTELGMKRELVVDRDPEEVIDGVGVDAIKAYIGNMETAKKKIDKRIATLSGEVFNLKKSTTQLFSRSKKSPSHTQPGYTLHEILTNTSGLSYFMEFMDRRRDMVKLQFWLMVEGLKNSIDDPATFIKDVKMMHETYFADTAPHKVQLSDSLLSDFTHAIERYSECNVGDLKQKLYRIQQYIFWQIEKEHFPHFKRSDLYFKFISSTAPKEDTPSSPSRRSLDDRTFYRDDRTESDFKRAHYRTLSDSNPTPFLTISGMLDSTRWDPVVLTPGEGHAERLEEPRRNKLIRSNTLDAIQAELRSIVEEPAPRPASVLLFHAKNVKSSTALPVQQIHTLPSWTSSGGTNSISQIEHDNLEPVKAREEVAADELNVHYAPPGDLMLEGKIEGIAQEIDLLKAHGDTVDAMIKTAGDHHREEELRILKKSKSVFRQELAQLEYQKGQYEQQMSENTLSSRSRVNITHATLGQDTHGDFALYVIEIQQLGYDGHFVSGWIVARRYSEFFALHQKLKETFAVKTIEFPAKWPLLKLQKPFLEARRASLERYLKQLLDDPAIRKSQELRAFLSQQNIFVPGPGNLAETPSVKNLQKSIEHLQNTKKHGFMSQIYKTVAANLDDILVGPTLLDMITQRLSEQVTSDLAGSSAQSVNSKSTETPVEAKTDTRLTESLCDLFIDMFELKDKTNWLRRQAIVILIQQILEGTIERKLKETLGYLTSHPMLVYYITKLTHSVWPEGQLAHKEPRKPEEKQQTKEEANRNLSRWLPDLLGNMVGRQNARKGARRLFTVLQNKRLNQDLMYGLLDEFIHALFPELEKKSESS
ncbi:PXA domain-containing protein [Sporodiniella umbellata]|nr:PXA domain-containing protein [Sporodiniella umbellata]